MLLILKLNVKPSDPKQTVAQSDISTSYTPVSGNQHKNTSFCLLEDRNTYYVKIIAAFAPAGSFQVPVSNLC